MKKLYVVMLLAVSMLSLSACTNKVDAASRNDCTCSNCKCCTCGDDEEQSKVAVENADDIFTQESNPAVEDKTEELLTQETAQVEETQTQKTVAELSEGEKAARKQQQANLAAAREQLYALNSSIEKTQKINEIDKQILANNSYDFSTKTIQFLGDSITEAICGDVDESGDFISYVNYANDYLQFNMCMNNGKAGRMFSDFGGEELSFSLDMGSMYNNSADISVIFLGVNDFLTNKEGKRYGDLNATESTAGYIGSVRYALRQLKNNYPDQDIFFVTMYNISKTSSSTYSDVAGSPTLGEYMDVLRKLVNESGYHLIELYDTGFMDCTDGATSSTYTADGLHPADSGNRILGEHIAAELSLYYSQKQ